MDDRSPCSSLLPASYRLLSLKTERLVDTIGQTRLHFVRYPLEYFKSILPRIVAENEQCFYLILK